jgi:hypothetical protein
MKTKNLIVNVCNPGDFDGFQYAFVELDENLAKLILQRRDLLLTLASTNNSLTCMEYIDFNAVFLNDLPDGTETPECDEGYGFDETELTVEAFEDFAERTDCDRMSITENGFCWTAYPHHAVQAIAVETDQIRYGVLSDLIDGIE